MGAEGSKSAPDKAKGRFLQAIKLKTGKATKTKKNVINFTTCMQVFNERDGERVHLVQIKNPWGGKREWNGAYSDE